mgnify:CR=1 FL=1
MSTHEHITAARNHMTKARTAHNLSLAFLVSWVGLTMSWGVTNDATVGVIGGAFGVACAVLVVKSELHLRRAKREVERAGL